MGDSKGKKFVQTVRDLNSFRWVFPLLGKIGWVKALIASVISLSLLAFAYFKHLPWPVIAFIALVSLFLVATIFMLSSMFSAQGRVAKLPAQKELCVVLTPHGDNSDLLCLEVKNLGDDAKITASIRVVSRSYGDSVNTRPYEGQWTLRSYKKRWDDYRPDPTTSEVSIPSGTHRMLEIARQDPENGRGNEISEAKLVGFDEFLRWDFEPKVSSKLPTLRLHIEFRAEGIKSP